MTIIERKMDISSLIRHKTICQCRRSSSPERELVEEEKIACHVHGLWTSGKCNPVEMTIICANLKLGLPVAEEFQLSWDEETKTFGEP